MHILQIKKKKNVRKCTVTKVVKPLIATGRFVLAAEQKQLLTFQQV